jgi:hypothetical protein
VAANDNAMVPTGLFIQTLNEMIDDHGKRLEALRNRVPNIVLVALYGVAIVACALAGYGNGFETHRVRLPVYTTALLIAAVILLIEDLDRTTTGFIKTSQQPMIDTIRKHRSNTLTNCLKAAMCEVATVGCRTSYSPAQQVAPPTVGLIAIC